MDQITDCSRSGVTDLRTLLNEYIERGEDHFPPLFRKIKPCIYFPLIKYRNFFPDGACPDVDYVKEEGFSDLFALLCKRRAPSKYDAIKECVYEIWALLEEKKVLEKYYYEGRDSEGIKNGLMGIAGNYIYAQVIKKEPEMSRLFKRVNSLLRDEQKFKVFPDAKEKEWWGLSSWTNPEEFHGSMEEMGVLLSPIPAVVRIKERPGAKKASMVITNLRLKELMVRILDALKKTLTSSRLIKAIGRKVPIIDAGFTSLDVPRKEGGEDEDGAGICVFPVKKAPSRGMAEDAGDFYDSLTERQQQVLRLYWLEERNLEETGSALGISKSLVAVEKNVILELLWGKGWGSVEEFELYVEALRNATLEKSGD
ncbi:MAG: sigma factor-like helix-turn-helix DNA-binding protein [PVC group bacterium]